MTLIQHYVCLFANCTRSPGMSSSGAEYVRGNVSHVIEIAGVVLLF